MSEQLVVVYDIPGDLNRVFDTGYTKEQISGAFRRCVDRYGTKANVRTMGAKRCFSMRGRR